MYQACTWYQCLYLVLRISQITEHRSEITDHKAAEMDVSWEMALYCCCCEYV